MRSSFRVHSHALANQILDESNEWVRPDHHATTEFKILTHKDYNVNTKAKPNLIRADNEAKKILESLGEKEQPTEEHVLKVLGLIGDQWPTQVVSLLGLFFKSTDFPHRVRNDQMSPAPERQYLACAWVRFV